MKAILTKFLPCTNTKPRRIVASHCGGVRKFYSVDAISYHDDEQLHRIVAKQFLLDVGWVGVLAMGCLKDGEYVHVFLVKPEVIAGEGSR